MPEIIDKEEDLSTFTSTALALTAACIATLDRTGEILRLVPHDLFNRDDAAEMTGRPWSQCFVPVNGPRGSTAVKPAPETVYLTAFRDRFIEWRFTPYSDQEGACLMGAGQDVTAHIMNARQLDREKSTLIGRNLELKCLYGIATLLGSSSLNLEQKLGSMVSLLPPAFQYPGLAVARLVIDDTGYASGRFPDAASLMSEPIRINGRDRGALTIAYDEKEVSSGQAGTLFSRKEKQLLRTVVQQLTLAVEKEEGEIRHRDLEHQLQHADRLATVGQLAAGIAHELNGPLNNILGYAQLAGKQQDLPEQVYTDLDNIVRFSLHTREIVKKVMLFSRQTPPKQEVVNLNTVIRDSLYFTEPLCSKSGVDIHCDLADELPDMTADSSQLHQVMVNLIVNAAQAMPESGGRIIISTGRISDAELFMTVDDTGDGMDDETLLHCFLPFYTTKDVDKGTGLGLSVVHGIVESHGGIITADSTPGKGTRFKIVFPVDQETFRTGETHV
ncbi:MAG: ATP-binding protein [Desulfobacterales bacterium]|nr:ATP-binding protein [Desulfobacterales bacterium]